MRERTAQLVRIRWRDPGLWLCHSDARQVFDLPIDLKKARVYDPRFWPTVKDRKSQMGLTSASRRLAALRSGKAMIQPSGPARVDFFEMRSPGKE